MINWIKQWFCDHDFEHVDSAKIMNHTIIHAFMCTKCGYIRKVKISG